MQELEKLLEQMHICRPVAWEQLPDIALYMDQLVGYMSRQLIDFASGEKLTSAMINNYIKDDLMPRADGKRYSREHIVYLTTICILKQVLSVRETKVFLDQSICFESTDGFYKTLGDCLDHELSALETQIHTEMSKTEMTDLVMQLAVGAYCQQLVCKRLIAVMRDADTDVKESKPKEVKEQKESKESKTK